MIIPQLRDDMPSSPTKEKHASIATKTPANHSTISQHGTSVEPGAIRIDRSMPPPPAAELLNRAVAAAARRRALKDPP